MASNLKQKGFTIVELMIAIAVFSVIMLLVTIGIIQIARNYQQAATRVKLEDASREIHYQIGQSIQFAGADVQSYAPGQLTGVASAYTIVCVGTQRYLWKDANTTTAGQVGLYIDTIAGPNACGTAAFNAASAQVPLPNNSRVVTFSVESSNAISAISTRFVVGDRDMFVGDDFANACVSAVSGSGFCAVVELNSAAARKVIKL